MRSKIISLILIVALPFLAQSQTMIVTKSATLTLDANNAGLSPGAMFDIVADTNWCDAPCVLKITDYIINGADSLILNSGGVGSVLHLWLDTVGSDFSARLETQEVRLAEVTSTATAKFGTWLLVNGDGAVAGVTVNVPNPVAGDWFGVVDSGSNAATFNITVDFTAAGDKFHRATANYVINSDSGSAEFTYVNSTVGWIKKSN